MTSPRRRTDPEHVDYSETRDGFSWQLPLNLGTVAGRGWLSIIALMVIGFFLGAGFLIYVNYQAFEAIASDHRSMLRSSDRLACIVSMTSEERSRFREGGGHWSQWCPWLMNGH